MIILTYGGNNRERVEKCAGESPTLALPTRSSVITVFDSFDQSSLKLGHFTPHFDGPVFSVEYIIPVGYLP